MESARLILRRLHDVDAAFLVELMNEPGWLAFIGDRGIASLDDARAYLRRAVSDMHEKHGFGLLGAALRETGELVGICGLVKRDTLPEPDLGFALLSRFERRGLAREAAAAVLAHAHDELAIPRILAITTPDNARSLRLLEAIGFRREGLAPSAPASGPAASEPLLLLAHGAAPPAMVARWERLWSMLGASGDSQAVLDDLVRRHGEAPRAYHVLAHVEHCLEEFESLRGLSSDGPLVELALWFHDAVHDPRAKDNEERSAELAGSAAEAMGLSPQRRDALRQLILATRHASPPAPGDESIVVDCDLAILGQPRERFDAYERAIRAEYAHVPRILFDAARARILRRLLDRPAIYSTEQFRARYEDAARENLRRSLRS